MSLTNTQLDRLCELEERVSAALAAEQPAEWIVKEDDPIMEAAAWGLDRVGDAKAAARMVSTFVGAKSPLDGVGAPTGQQFRGEYVTTYGRRMSAPRKMHERAAVFARLLVKPHEWQHVKQHADGVKESGWPEFTSHSVLYLAGVLANTPDGSRYVGKVEGDGYGVTECVRLFFTGNTRNLDEIVGQLRAHYNLAGLGSGVAEGVLRSHYQTMRVGAVPNCWAARITMDVLSRHGADLKGLVIE